MALPAQFGRHTALDMNIRTAERKGDYIDAVSNRIDLGLLWSANWLSGNAGYFGLNAIYEMSDADIKYVSGEREGDAYGLRLQAGEVLGAVWAWSARAENIWWDGDGFIERPAPTGTIHVSQAVEYQRTYANAEMIARYAFPDLMASNAQLRWRGGVHYLETRYEDQSNNLGQAATEPYGPNERLGIIRTGGYFSWRVGADKKWSPYTELLYDYEFENNMNDALDDPHTISAKLGMARLFGPGQRVQLEVQRYQGLKGDRIRNGINLTAVLDF